MNCPGCGKDMGQSKDYVEMRYEDKWGYWCLPCAKAKFKAREVTKARAYAKHCEARQADTLLVIGTWIQLLNGHDLACPCCGLFIGMMGNAKIMLSIATDGYICGLCGFFLPDLPSLIFNTKGNIWWGREEKGAVK